MFFYHSKGVYTKTGTCFSAAAKRLSIFLYALFPKYYYRKALKQNRQAEEACRVHREKIHQANVEEWEKLEKEEGEL